MFTILFLNQKGGVGKTTLADELAFALERRGSTVAFVSTDPQGGSVHEVCDDPDLYWSSFLVTLCSEIMLYIETPLVSYSYSLNEVSHSCTS